MVVVCVALKLKNWFCDKATNVGAFPQRWRQALQFLASRCLQIIFNLSSGEKIVMQQAASVVEEESKWICRLVAVQHFLMFLVLESWWALKIFNPPAPTPVLCSRVIPFFCRICSIICIYAASPCTLILSTSLWKFRGFGGPWVFRV